jgi:hypothetical protein
LFEEREREAIDCCAIDGVRIVGIGRGRTKGESNRWFKQHGQMNDVHLKNVRHARALERQLKEPREILGKLGVGFVDKGAMILSFEKRANTNHCIAT